MSLQIVKKYDPKVGFTVPIVSISQEDEYTCVFRKGDMQFESSVYLMVTRK